MNKYLKSASQKWKEIGKWNYVIMSAYVTTLHQETCKKKLMIELIPHYEM